jgi:hypothetical protein
MIESAGSKWGLKAIGYQANSWPFMRPLQQADVLVCVQLAVMMLYVFHAGKWLVCL